MTDAPRRIEYMPLADILRAPRNPKQHDAEAIGGSVSRFGLVESPCLDERTGRLVAGHGRLDDLEAKHAAGEAPPDGITLADDGTWLVPVQRGWRSRSDTEAEGYLVASNRIGERGGWDDTGLAEMLAGIAQAEPDLTTITGYDPGDIAALHAGLAEQGNPFGWQPGGGTYVDGDDEPTDQAEAEAETAARDDGSLLALVDVSVEEPKHQVETGEVWYLGDLHLLVVASVHTDHELWAPMLRAGTVFIPYPGPYLALTSKATDTPLLLVHPDPYLAGHILDKYAAIHGDGSTRRAEITEPAR